MLMTRWNSPSCTATCLFSAPAGLCTTLTRTRVLAALRVYSGTAIQCTRVLNSAFQLSLRSTQGFVSSLLELLRSQGASMTSGV